MPRISSKTIACLRWTAVSTTVLVAVSITEILGGKMVGKVVAPWIWPASKPVATKAGRTEDSQFRKLNEVLFCITL